MSKYHPQQDPTTSDKLEEFDENSPIANMFRDIESKIDNLSDFKIASTIEMVQMSLLNNQKRMLALESLSPHCKLDLHARKLEILQENHFLAGRLLPKLYARVAG